MMVLSPTKKTSTKSPPISGNSTKGQCGNLKLQRGAKPFSGKKFFLDLKNLNASSKLEASIKTYGGVVSPFLGKDINLVVTDRAEWGGNVNAAAGGSPLATPRPSPSPSPSPLPQLFSPGASPAGNSRSSNVSPTTQDSPAESVSGGRRHPKSRAEAMLERVRLQPQFRTRDPLLDAQSWNLSIWSLERFLRLIHKINQSEKKGAVDSQSGSCKKKSITVDRKPRFRSGKYFLKIESLDGQARPSFKDFPCWPTLNFNSEPGTCPFGVKLSPSRNETPAQSNLVSKANEVTSVKNKALGSAKVQTSFRQSPRKKGNNKRSVPPQKGNVNGAYTAASSLKRCPSELKHVQDGLNLVPPRPPSKRHPDRSLFPSSKKQGYDPQAGYCEICKVDFSDLRSHVETDSHKSFSMNDENYASLDLLISSKQLHVDAFSDSVNCEPSRNSVLEGTVIQSNSTPDLDHPVENDVNMRQPVDERPIPLKMVGRKDALEVQCNGLSNHVQTRFTCTKGDRENLGSIFLDERISAAQLRRRRAISVSCKDLLELSPSGERTHHYLRSARAARSELSQLSPALSDNSHPLLNGNSQQPLLSPTLSERSHTLRTRSQLWLPSNLISDESLLVTANNHSDKPRAEKPADKMEKGEKTDKNEKVDKNEKSKVLEDSDVACVARDADRDHKDTCDRDVKTQRNHCKNRSIRRKRLSAEEKLIEDNRGYYKVEVLNSKLRSTGYFVNHASNQGDETVNGRLTPVGRPGAQGEIKEPVVVRFKKVRRSELSVLSDEAENFMFGEQARSESNSDDSSEYDTEGEEEDMEYEEHRGDEGSNNNENDEDGDNDNEEQGIEGRSSRSSHRNGRHSNSGNRRSRDKPRRFKIKVGGGAYSRCSAVDGMPISASHGSNVESNGHRKHRKRRTQAEAFIIDNMDYYKFEMAGSRLRIHGFPSSPTGEADDSVNEKPKPPCTNETSGTEIDDKLTDGAPCPIDKLHFSFESVPSSEVWYQTFQRQDRGEELCFPLVGEPSSVLLPYQISKAEGVNGQRPGGRHRSRNSMRLPRKSPRCHASTLAILSSLVRRRSSRDPEKANTVDDPVIPDLNQDIESKHIPCKKVTVNQNTSDLGHAKDVPVQEEEDIQEVCRNIDAVLLNPFWSDFDKDSDIGESKSPGKGRGRKKHGLKSTPSCNDTSGNSVPNSEKEKDPTLKYLVDPAIFDELACTCDTVANPWGGPTMDIVTLLNSYSDCCCIVDSTADHCVDASCNSSECGTSSTCEMDRRMRKKKKRRNMTGWDKPKRKGILRRNIIGGHSQDGSEDATKVGVESVDVVENSLESEASGQRAPQGSARLTFQRCARTRKLRSSLVDCPTLRGDSTNPTRVRMLRADKETGSTLSVKKGTFKKVRKIGWTKVR